jgi:hypothetical protein
MENNKTILYLKTDDNKIIKETQIRWVKKMSECLEVCTKSVGCNSDGNGEGGTHRICKLNNLDSYNALNQYFE